jgi:hypothetical protein
MAMSYLIDVTYQQGSAKAKLKDGAEPAAIEKAMKSVANPYGMDAILGYIKYAALVTGIDSDGKAVSSGEWAGAKVKAANFRLPWNRTFEVAFDLSVGSRS